MPNVYSVLLIFEMINDNSLEFLNEYLSLILQDVEQSTTPESQVLYTLSVTIKVIGPLVELNHRNSTFIDRALQCFTRIVPELHTASLNI